MSTRTSTRPAPRGFMVWIARDPKVGRNTYLYLEKPVLHGGESYWVNGPFSQGPLRLPRHHGLKPGQCREVWVSLEN